MLLWYLFKQIHNCAFSLTFFCLSSGLFIPSALMFSVCYVDSDRNLIVALLTMAVGFSGFTMAGYSVNHLDIAPTFAGILVFSLYYFDKKSDFGSI